MCPDLPQHAEYVRVTVAFDFPYNCSVNAIVNEVEQEIRRHLFTYRFKVLGATIERRTDDDA